MTTPASRVTAEKSEAVGHTARPWALDNDGWIVGANGEFAVCLIDGSRSAEDMDPEDRANSSLILAAPDLLILVRDALEYLEGTNPLNASGGIRNVDLRKRIQVVIAKAEGRS